MSKKRHAKDIMKDNFSGITVTKIVNIRHYLKSKENLFLIDELIMLQISFKVVSAYYNLLNSRSKEVIVRIYY